MLGHIGIMMSTEKYDNILEAGVGQQAAVQEIYALAETLAGKGQYLLEMAVRIETSKGKLIQNINSISGISKEIGKFHPQPTF